MRNRCKSSATLNAIGKPPAMLSSNPPPLIQARVDVPPRAPLRTRHPSLNEGLRETQSHDGLLPRRSSAPVWDAWEQRMLQQQRREIAQQRCSKWTGYTRGPAILKALAELKSRSHS
jgi:hypothetical protein